LISRALCPTAFFGSGLSVPQLRHKGGQFFDMGSQGYRKCALAVDGRAVAVLFFFAPFAAFA
jgi:hypothetical protein